MPQSEHLFPAGAGVGLGRVIDDGQGMLELGGHVESPHGFKHCDSIWQENGAYNIMSIQIAEYVRESHAIMPEYDGILALERMERAVWKVRDRLLRATAALEKDGVPYAVVGGNAVAAWVEQIEEAAVRATQDIDLAIRRGDLDKAKVALGAVGFIYCHVAGVDLFLDGPDATPRDAVHLVMAGEKVRPQYVAAVPDVAESESFKAYRVLSLESLVRMKLTSYRRKDQVHLLDMIEVGLLDASWPKRFQPELASRLQELFDNPDG